MTMSKVEGPRSLSSLERSSAGKYHLFILVNVFLGSIITGTALQQLKQFTEAPTGEYVTFLICYSSVNLLGTRTEHKYLAGHMKYERSIA